MIRELFDLDDGGGGGITTESSMEGYEFGEATYTAVRFNTVGDLVNGYHEARTKLGNSITRPDRSADDYKEQLGKVHDFLGRPKESGSYKLDATELPGGQRVSDDLSAEYRKEAHHQGLPQAQANGLYKWFGDRTGKAVNQQNENERERSEATEKEWRDLHGEYADERQAVVKRLLLGMLKDNNVSNADEWVQRADQDPVLRTVAYSLLEDRMDDSFVSGTPGSGSRGAGGGIRDPQKAARDSEGNVLPSNPNDFYNSMDDAEYDNDSSIK